MKDEQNTELSQEMISQIETKLLEWQREIEANEHAIDSELTQEHGSEIIDMANKENMLGLELEKSNRNAKTLRDIRLALRKIREGTYGICEDSGEFIETNRLKANPLARFSLEAQQEMEDFQKRRLN